MEKPLAAGAALAILVSAVAARADERPYQELSHAAELACYTLREAREGKADSSKLHYGEDCLREADKLLAGGVAPSTMINFDTCKVGPASPASLADIREKLCVATRDKVKNVIALEPLRQAASSAAARIDQMKSNDEIVAQRQSGSQNMLAVAAECSTAADQALAAGVPASEPVDFNVYDSGIAHPLSLADVKDKVCRAAHDLASANSKKLIAADEAAYAPFLAALRGDKRTLFKSQHMLDGTNYFGHHGRRLNKPADFKASDAWYYFVTDRNGITPRWEIEGWTFTVDKQTGRFNKSGLGEMPPSSAFR
jgi:hypothetical protein